MHKPEVQLCLLSKGKKKGKKEDEDRWQYISLKIGQKNVGSSMATKWNRF